MQSPHPRPVLWYAATGAWTNEAMMWALEHVCLCRCEHVCVFTHVWIHTCVHVWRCVCSFIWGGMYRCTSFVSWEVEGLSVEEGKASKCYCGHRLCVPWPLQKVNWSRGCLGRGIRSDTVLRICWKSASRGLMLALLPKLDSNSHGRLFAKPFIHVTLFHPNRWVHGTC